MKSKIKKQGFLMLSVLLAVIGLNLCFFSGEFIGSPSDKGVLKSQGEGVFRKVWALLPSAMKEETHWVDEVDQPLLEESIKQMVQFAAAPQNLSELYNWFQDVDLTPVAQENPIGEIYIVAHNWKPGLRYYEAKFDIENKPEFFRFELEPFKGGLSLLTQAFEKQAQELGVLKECSSQKGVYASYKINGHIVSFATVRKGDVDVEHGGYHLKEDVGAIEAVVHNHIHHIEC